jgi:hypothetical protein
LYTELPCDVMLFHEVASSALPVVTLPAGAPGSVYGPCGFPQPSVPALGGVLPLLAVPLLAAPLLAVPLLAGPLLAGALLPDALLAGALEPLVAGALAELDAEVGGVVDEFACPGELEQAANNNDDAAARAVSVTARVLVMKDPPRSAAPIRQRRPP